MNDRLMQLYSTDIGITFEDVTENLFAKEEERQATWCSESHGVKWLSS